MTTGSGSPNIILDPRCLQDANYARRGIGRHALALLRHAPRGLRLTGLVDDTLPPLLAEAAGGGGYGSPQRLCRQRGGEAARAARLLRHAGPNEDRRVI